MGCVVGGAITDRRAFHTFSSVIALISPSRVLVLIYLYDMILILLLIDVDKCFLFETFQNS